VTFTNAQAIASNNATGAHQVVYPTANNVVEENIVQNGHQYTDITFPGSRQIKATYLP